jgi:hypothetical protein
VLYRSALEFFSLLVLIYPVSLNTMVFKDDHSHVDDLIKLTSGSRLLVLGRWLVLRS